MIKNSIKYFQIFPPICYIPQTPELIPNKKIILFASRICSKFTCKKIEQRIQGFIEVLANLNPDVKLN